MTTPPASVDGDTPARVTKRSHKGKVCFLLAATLLPCHQVSENCRVEALQRMLPSGPLYLTITHCSHAVSQAPQRYEDSLAGSAPRTDKRPRTAKRFADD